MQYQHCFLFDDMLPVFLVGKFKREFENCEDGEKLKQWNIILAEVRIDFRHIVSEDAVIYVGSISACSLMVSIYCKFRFCENWLLIKYNFYTYELSDTLSNALRNHLCYNKYF